MAEADAKMMGPAVQDDCIAAREHELDMHAEECDVRRLQAFSTGITAIIQTCVNAAGGSREALSELAGEALGQYLSTLELLGIISITLPPDAPDVIEYGDPERNDD